MLSWYHWLIIVVPVLAVCCAAVRCHRYVRSVSDFLVAGRCAGRYVLLSGGIMGSLSVVSFISAAEANYNTGYAMSFWNNIMLPLGIVMALFGWIHYRFRETRAMSAGQFLEMRYSRGVRRLAAILRGSADMLANCIGPAVAVRFFIYLLGIPHRFQLFGHTVPSFPFLLAVCISLALLMILTGGRISLLVTDAVQGLVSYPIFVIMCIFVMTQFSWGDQISAVMADRVPGESFLNPYDIQELRDFNLFALFVTVFNTFFGGQWIGNGYGTVARSPHEGKMSGIIGNFGTGFAWLMPLFFVLVILTVMNHRDFAPEAHKIRQELSVRASDELSADPALVNAVADRLAQLPEQRHVIGVDPPLSRNENLDTPYLEAVRQVYLDRLSPEAGNKLYQGYRTTYMQQMLPLVLRRFFPPTLVALLVMLFVLLVVSTDDTRIFDSSTTWVQDFILPFFRKPPSPETHLRIFKTVVCLVGVIFWCGSYFLAQMDYINMFVTIACSLWVAGAGAVVTCGLYWRRGTTAGAYASLIAGGGISLLGILVQRNWADGVYPWLLSHGLADSFRHFLEAASSPFRPWIDWRVADALWPVKFPINSTEINFIAAATSVILYFVVSLLTCRKPFNLERMLHRGIYAVEDDAAAPAAAEPQPSFARRLLDHLVSITPEYTRGDRIIAWGVFFYSIVYQFLFAFIGVTIASRVFHWGVPQWSRYFFVVTLAVPCLAGLVTTFWFAWGTSRDIRRLFRDLEARTRDALDNGMVEGHVSLVDKAAFAEREK